MNFRWAVVVIMIKFTSWNSCSEEEGGLRGKKKDWSQRGLLGYAGAEGVDFSKGSTDISVSDSQTLKFASPMALPSCQRAKGILLKIFLAQPQ